MLLGRQISYFWRSKSLRELAQDCLSLIRSSLCSCNLVIWEKSGKTWQKARRSGNKPRTLKYAPSRVNATYPGSSATCFLLFLRHQAAIVFYAAVGTRQSVPYFEVCCSSLSAQLVLESPVGETYSAAWQPETGGRRKGGGRKAVFFFFLSSAFFSP